MLSAASLMILTAWVGLGSILVGLGFLVRRVFRWPARDAEGLLLSFWLGWAALLLVLQIWHLFFPVGKGALCLVAAAGVFGLVTGGGRPWVALARGMRRNGLALLALALVAVWLSNLALTGPRHGDAGAYFIPTVRWLAEYRIVPGLGNLYVPLAFNQSYFLYVAMLDVGPFAQRSHHLANGILLLALLARQLLAVQRLTRGRAAHSPEDFFYALCLPVAAGLSVSLLLTSASPDFSIALLGVILSGRWIRFLCCDLRPPELEFELFAIALLAVAALTVKLSIVGLSAATLTLALGVWLTRDRPPARDRRRVLIAITGVAAVGFGVWMARNAILSGCPFYPNAFAALPVDWRVAEDAMAWVKRPMQLPGPSVWLAEPRWFARRLANLGWGERDVLLPLGIALAAGAATLWVRVFVSEKRSPRRVRPLVSVPAIASLVFTFAVAPMARYAGAMPWVLAAESLLLLLGGAAFGRGWRGRWAALAGSILVAVLPLLDAKYLWRDPARFENMPRVGTAATRLESGLVIRVPTRGVQCWGEPLPCAPEPNPALRLRKEGDLASGFVVRAAPFGN